MIKHTILSIIALAALHTAAAEIRMPRFFSDNMVLQRELPVRIWGTASKGERITVSFGGSEVATTADRSGRWQAMLPAMEADSTPQVLIVAGRDNQLRFENVLIGDVWLCSGQSNMEWRLDPTIGCKQEIAASANAEIRLLSVGDKIAFEEQDDIVSGTWVECTPETSRIFSAVAYYFGKFLHEHTGIPIGLIDSSWGGTDIETWTSWPTMRTTKEYAQYAGKDSPREAIGSGMKRYEAYKTALERDRGDMERWYDPDIDVSENQWRTMHLPQIWENTLGAVDGHIWFRRTVTLPASVAGRSGLLSLPAVDDSDISYVNGRKIGQSSGWDVRRCYEIPAGLLHEGDNVVAIRVADTGGNGGIWGDTDKLYIEIEGERYDLSGEWQYRPSATTTMFGIDRNGDFGNPNSFASLLYNGMIAPLAGYGIKGAIWYQGENNAGRALSYRKAFPAMILDWRERWGYDFPFCWVQLANYMAVEQHPTESEWAELREAQNMTLALPHTGQAVITDIGEADDIHPRNKRDVGYRLSRAALNIAYGCDDVAGGGPVYRSMERDGNRVVLRFDATGELRPTDDNRYRYLHGFAIAGADRRFVWGKAYISGSNEVVVFSDEIADPVAVRYGWANNPYDDDLTDDSGLLASPFRTDDWPGITR